MKNNYFFLLLGSTFLLSFFSKILLNTDDLIANSLSEQFTIEQINAIINFREKWQWVAYFFLPVLPFIKNYKL